MCDKMPNLNRAKILLALNILDAVLTRIAIDYYEGVELNPIIGQLAHSQLSFWAYKVLVPLGIVAVLLAISTKYPKAIRRILIGLIVGMCLICLWNTVALISLGG